jgi:hypothetical protein
MDPEFIGSATLTQDTISFTELKVKHYKIILKSIFGDTIDYYHAFKNIDNILSILTDKPLCYIQQLNFIDYFLLLFEIRNLSIGSLIVAETTDDTALKIDINVQKLIEILLCIDIQNVLNEEHIDNFTIKYKLPTISNIISINNTSNNINSVYNFFIESITHDSLLLNFNDLTIDETNIILEKIPAKITTSIIKNVQNIVNVFNSVNLISYLPGLEGKQLIFNFNINNLGIILKLLFGDQLLSLYENIFKLSKNGISPQYIENCTPGEYMLYIKKLEASLRIQQPDDVYNNISVDDQADIMDIDNNID